MITSRKVELPSSAPRGMGFRMMLAATVLLPLAPAMVLAADAPGAGQPANQPAGQAATQAPSAAPAATAPGARPITPASTPNDAVRVLLDQANYWRGQYQPAQAIDALNRVLQISPRNTDALAMMSELQAERGNISAAQNAFSRLKSVSPGDPRIPTIDQALRVGKISTQQLSQARNLATEGRPADAVSQYQRIFKGDQPTPGLSTEYYSVLSGTDQGWEKAKEGLGKQVIANPQDARAQLAYAKLLTYREQSRAEGITRLKQLAGNPAVAADANTALRQALLWLPSSAASVGQLQTYAQQHPDDAEISQKLEAARHPSAADPVGEMRVEGFADLNHGRINQAESQFQTALKNNPNDADATGGLGLVRLRQGRTAEARRLLDRAIELNPAKKRQWQAALAGASNTGNGAAVGRQWDEVRTLANRGEYGAAQAKLRPLLGRDQSNTGGMLLLADIQQRAGQLAEAESTYRTIMDRQPRNSAAVVGLAGVLSREGRSTEADQLFARAEQLGARGVGQARAAELRQRAEEVSDPVAQAGLYRAAIAVDPANPWLRLELARNLVKQNRLPEARAVMAGVGDGPRPSQEQVRAALIFANETNDYATATALINRIPPKQRTADMRDAIQTAQVKSDIAAAAQLYYVNRPLARERMLALASTPDQDGVHGAEVARAFLAMNDKFGAREAISTAMSVNRSLTPQARLAYSGVLLQAGQTDAAAAVAGTVTPGNVAPAQRRALSQLQSGIAVRAADQLNNQGRTADAYDKLAPALAQSPTNPDLNMALARLYAKNQQPDQALAINEALLRQDPDNLSVRRAAVNAAIQASQYDRAQRLVQDALQMSPNDPQVWVMSADLAKARGNTGRALHDYQVARDLHRQQLSGDIAPSAPPSMPASAPAALPQAGNANYAPNILSAPLPTAPGMPGNLPNGPMPLDVPKRGTRSDNGKRSQERDADAGRDGTQDVAEADTGEQVQQAQKSLARVELAQATLPYYVSPAPQLPGMGGAQVLTAPSASPDSAVNGYGGGYGSGVATYPGNAGAAPYAAYGAPTYPVAPSPAAPSYAPPAPRAAAPAYGGYGSGYGGGYANPFRGGGDTTLESSAAGILGGSAYAPPPPAPVDPLTQDIDQNITALRTQMAPKVEGGFGFRARSGDQGLSQLTEEFVPLQATYSPGIGELKLQVTPTFLQGGSLGDSVNRVNRFGSLPLYAVAPNATTVPGNVPRPGSQDASGVGIDVGYGWNWISGDIGTTPVGFREQNIIGGVELAPKFTNEIGLRVTAERRAVTDSVLSYAGTRDPGTGIEFGGVMRNRIHAQLEYGGPDGLNLYGGGGYGVLLGDNVQTNKEWEFGAGGSYPVYRGVNDEVRVGVDLVYFGYENNAYFFTLGGGGYFSPQSYFAALLPVTYRQTVGNLNWSVGASVGFQTFREDGSAIFPGNFGGLQTRLNQLASGNPLLATYYPGQSDSDFAGGVQGDVEYKMTPAIAVGARAGIQHTGNFTEGGGLIYARYAFGVQ